MLNVLFFIIGFLICWLITKEPLQIKIHRVNESIINGATDTEVRTMEEKMFEPDTKMDDKYDNFEQNINDILKEVSETMGGSDR